MNDNINIQNGKERDILQQEHLRENPYGLPQNYFAAVEDAVREKIHGKPSKAEQLRNGFQTCVAFASVFAIVFGLGYGAMYVTGTATEAATNEENGTEQILSQTQPVPTSDTLNVEKDYIEQYLIDSNVSIATLASVE